MSSDRPSMKEGTMLTFDFTVQEPASKGEILAQLRELHQASIAFWDAFSTDDFFAPVGTGWSPAGNVRHLNKAIQPLVRALGLPTILPRVLFGKAKGPSRSYANLRDTYLATLNNGAGAGSFAPEAIHSTGNADEQRAQLMATREALASKLASTIGGWNEDGLDYYQLPHPLLGKLTVREMLFFTVYHNYHHVRSVATRLLTARGQAPEASA
jgi:hypothetical protein